MSQTKARPDKNPDILQTLMEVNAKRSMGDFDNSLPYAETMIPANILISCPMDKTGMIRAIKCNTCLHFHGVVQQVYDDQNPLPWDVKYSIKCGFPLERKCISFNEE